MNGPILSRADRDAELIETLAYSEALLRDRLREAEVERDAYQEIAHAALDRLHSTTLVLDRTRTQLRRLLAAHPVSRADRATEEAAA